MADIKIVSNNQNLQLDFTFDTTQLFLYTIKIMDSSGNILFGKDGTSKGVRSYSLGPAQGFVGSHLLIAWTIEDPVGAGNMYSVHAIVSQNGVQCQVTIVCAGKTDSNATNATSVATFVV
jgi:hypothetical protein